MTAQFLRRSRSGLLLLVALATVLATSTTACGSATTPAATSSPSVTASSAPPSGGSATAPVAGGSTEQAAGTGPTAPNTPTAAGGGAPAGEAAVSSCPLTAEQVSDWFGRPMVPRIDAIQPEPLTSEVVNGNTTYLCGFVPADGSNPDAQDYPALIDLSFSVGSSAANRWDILGPTYPAPLYPAADWLTGLDAWEHDDGSNTADDAPEVAVTVHTDGVLLDLVVTSYGSPVTLSDARQRVTDAVTTVLRELSNS